MVTRKLLYSNWLCVNVLVVILKVVCPKWSFTNSHAISKINIWQFDWILEDIEQTIITQAYGGDQWGFNNGGNFVDVM